MSLKEILSCYVSKSYKCDKEIFQKAQAYFESAYKYAEESWKRKTISDTKVVFTKGSGIILTFNYSRNTGLQVKTVLEYDESSKILKMKVGNSGFPFEPLLSKKRYENLIELIHSYFIDNEIGIVEISESEDYLAVFKG